jgi:hypothetical protein
MYIGMRLEYDKFNCWIRCDALMDYRSDLFANWVLPEEICRGETAFVRYLGAQGENSKPMDYFVKRLKGGFCVLEGSWHGVPGTLLSRQQIDESLFVISEPTIPGIVYRALMDFATFSL